jgi:sn-glycerol 3-phosphate transport system permease protein
MTTVSETTQTRTRERRLRRRNGIQYSKHIPLIIVCLFVAFPAIYALLIATMTRNQAFQYPPRLTPGSDLLDNIDTLIELQQFDTLFINTFVVAMVVVIGKTITSMLAGLAFVYFRFPGKWFLFFFVLLTLLMPTEIIIVPLFRLSSDLEWAKTNPRLALTIPFLASATGAFLFRQHFSNIPRELLDAAQMDGATPMRFLFSILFPMSWNVIGAMAVIQFIYMWHQYLWPIIIISETEDQLIQVGVNNAFAVGAQTDFGIVMAAGVIASVPPLIVFVLLQRQFMSGFSLTRDK